MINFLVLFIVFTYFYILVQNVSTINLHNFSKNDFQHLIESIIRKSINRFLEHDLHIMLIENLPIEKKSASLGNSNFFKIFNLILFFAYRFKNLVNNSIFPYFERVNFSPFPFWICHFFHRSFPQILFLIITGSRLEDFLVPPNTGICRSSSLRLCH